MSNTPRPSLQECRQERIARRIDRPACGWWAVRLVSGGPEIAARIFRVHTTFEPGEPQNLMIRSPFLAAEIDGRTVDPEEVWTRRGRAISPEFYDWLLADRKWARAHAPASPEANPTRKVDVRSLAPIMPPRSRA